LSGGELESETEAVADFERKERWVWSLLMTGRDREEKSKEIVGMAKAVTGWARKGLGATLGQDSKIRWTSILFDLVRCRRTGQGSRGIRQSVSCKIFHSFSSSISIRDELVESSSDSCNILPETVTKAEAEPDQEEKNG
jgi:hypothetical protein